MPDLLQYPDSFLSWDLHQHNNLDVSYDALNFEPSFSIPTGLEPIPSLSAPELPNPTDLTLAWPNQPISMPHVQQHHSLDIPPCIGDHWQTASTTLSPLTETTSEPTELPIAVQTPDHSNLNPGLTLSSNKKPKRRREETPVDVDTLVKRQRNNIAAKKYRQKKIDRIEELEQEVDVVKKERDELRIRLARQEAETAALREMLKLATAGGKKVH